MTATATKPTFKVQLVSAQHGITIPGRSYKTVGGAKRAIAKLQQERADHPYRQDRIDFVCTVTSDQSHDPVYTDRINSIWMKEITP